MDEKKEKPGILGWFAGNHVAANLLMFLIIASGSMAIWNSKKEVFPELNLDMVSISVPYRGASPEDVEEGVCLRVEESVGSVDGIKRMTSTASIASKSVCGSSSPWIRIMGGRPAVMCRSEASRATVWRRSSFISMIAALKVFCHLPVLARQISADGVRLSGGSAL